MSTRETSLRLAEMIDFLPDPTMIIDREGVVVSWNRAMEQMSGIPASAILGRGKPLYTTWISNQARADPHRLCPARGY